MYILPPSSIFPTSKVHRIFLSFFAIMKPSFRRIVFVSEIMETVAPPGSFYFTILETVVAPGSGLGLLPFKCRYADSHLHTHLHNDRH